jgi:hypothetical protein
MVLGHHVDCRRAERVGMAVVLEITAAMKPQIMERDLPN